jgi:hypothetical protein
MFKRVKRCGKGTGNRNREFTCSAGSRVLAVVVVLTGWVRLPRGWEAAPKMVARTSINCQADGRLVTR